MNLPTFYLRCPFSPAWSLTAPGLNQISPQTPLHQEYYWWRNWKIVTWKRLENCRNSINFTSYLSPSLENEILFNENVSIGQVFTVVFLHIPRSDDCRRLLTLCHLAILLGLPPSTQSPHGAIILNITTSSSSNPHSTIQHPAFEKCEILSLSSARNLNWQISSIFRSMIIREAFI